jgi:hypothetical protein
MHPDPHAQLVRLLLGRLERISADSHWAHRAGGIRGTLLTQLEGLEAGQAMDEAALGRALEIGFKILQGAAAGRGKPDE